MKKLDTGTSGYNEQRVRVAEELYKKRKREGYAVLVVGVIVVAILCSV